MSVSATQKILCLHLEMWWTVIVNVTSLLYLDLSADCVLNVSTKLTKIFKIYLLFI